MKNDNSIPFLITGGTIDSYYDGTRDTPAKQLTNHQKVTAAFINSTSGMHSFSHLIHGSFPRIMRESGFKTISVREITQESCQR